MIPKKIHYCWFGHNPKPKLAEKCIKSWKKFCPDYEIIEWNEDNYDLSSAPLYVRQAYEAKKWAFVTDYVRLQVIYEHGGIYMDTDVELIKPLEPLLQYNAYFGFEDGKHINTGLGFGAVEGTPILHQMMEDYKDIPFVLPNGTFDITPCPVRNTRILLTYGLQQDDSEQILDGNILILPSIYLCPVSYHTGVRNKSKKTYSIHWFSASWQMPEQRKKHLQNQKEERIKKIKDYWKCLPNRILLKILGENRYNKLKVLLKKG